jgi:hypothetical protein
MEKSWHRRLVLDTNQVDLLSKVPVPHRVTISPYVLAEILLRRNPGPTLEVLRSYDVKLGLETLDVMVQVADLDANKFLSFEPFPRGETRYRQDYRLMMKAFESPGSQHLNWAKTIKDDHLAWCASLVTTSIRFREKMRSKGIKMKFASFSEAFEAFTKTSDSFLPSLVVDTVTNGGQRETKLAEGELVDAVFANQYLARLFRMELAYVLSVSRAWGDQRFNFDPEARRDDVTDATLPLYAGPRDVILTADSKLRKLVELVEAENGGVTTRTVQELR